MGGIDQGLEVLRPSVGRIGREKVDAVVAPIATAREIGDRHQLDRGDAELDEIVQLVDGRAERAFGRERPDVQLVDDRLLPGAAAPRPVAPLVGARIDHLARAMHVLRLVT